MHSNVIKFKKQSSSRSIFLETKITSPFEHSFNIFIDSLLLVPGPKHKLLINKNIAVLLQLRNVPILGICFGYQIMVASYGGKIDSMELTSEGNIDTS